MDGLQKQILCAKGDIQADLVLKNASWINVFSQTIEHGDLAIVEDKIVGIGHYHGEKEIDCEGLFVAPGFIDAHVHIESSMVTPEVFSHLVLPKGVTTVIADPHEIANVLGKTGLEFMLENRKKAMLDVFFMLPSCVPAVSFEDNGAHLTAADLEEFVDDTHVLGLGEVMDVPAVIHHDSEMIDKITMIKNHHKQADGHSPKVDLATLNAYLCANIRTDHECTTKEEALEKIKLGMYVMLREGSQAKDLSALLGAVSLTNYHRFLFCTDDRHIEDLIEEGSIDHSIRKAIKAGLNPIMAFTMASFNAAVCYHLTDRGAIAPGYLADLVLFKNLLDLDIKVVIKKGKVYTEEEIVYEPIYFPSVHTEKVSLDTFHVIPTGNHVHVIQVQEGSLITNKKLYPISHINQLNKIAVIERHKHTGKHFTGYIEGLQLKGGAIAQTISHDSHNIIVFGEKDEDMVVAVNQLIEQDGGIVFASLGQVEAALKLPIGGIMTHEDPKEVLKTMKKLNHLAREHGIPYGFDPYITLAFMALPVIPDLKITPRGLFDYQSFNFIDLFEEGDE